MDEKKLQKEAKKRLAAKLSFYIHGAVFVPTILLLAFINLTITPRFLWFLFPLAGWGLGVLIHGLIVFVALNRNLKKHLIEKEMNRLQGVSANKFKNLNNENQAFKNYVPMSWKETEIV